MRARRSFLAALAFVLAAGVCYVWVTGFMDSITNYRSPIHDRPLPSVSATWQPLTGRVVIVLIDGLRYDTSRDVRLMPFLNQLRVQAADAHMWSIPPTYSQPAWVTLISGGYPEISDSEIINVDQPKIRRIDVDTIFSLAHRRGLRTALAGQDWWQPMLPPADLDEHFFTPGEDRQADEATVAAALPWLQARKDALVWVHLDQVDYAAYNEGGTRDPRWDQAVMRSDALLQRVAAALDLSRDTLLVTSDEGQIDQGGHGGPEPATEQEPFVLAGAGVKPGDYGEIQLTDVAPTIAALMGLGIPGNSQGHVLPLAAQPLDTAAAVRAQQGQLASAYLPAVGAAPQGLPPGGDPVAQAQALMDAARAARLNAEMLPRALLAAAVLLALLLLVWRTWRREWLPLLLGAAAYVVLFNAIYILLQNRTYSLSSVKSTGDVIGTVALDTAVALVAAWLAAMWPVWRARPGGRVAAHRTALFAAYVLLLAGLPVLWGFATCGLAATWALPDFTYAFLYFLGLLQMMVAAALALVLMPLAALAARQPGARAAARGG